MRQTGARHCAGLLRDSWSPIAGGRADRRSAALSSGDPIQGTPEDVHRTPRGLVAQGISARFATIRPCRNAPSARMARRSRSMPASEIRQHFLDFFAERGHEVVPSASLVPAGDQTLLFTNSGMVQFKEVLTGAETRSYKRAVDVPALPARRRQAQRLRGGRPHHAPPHLLRDARQLELRRLLQARGDRMGQGAADRGLQDPVGAPRRDDLQGRRGGAPLLARGRHARGAHGDLGRRRQGRRPQLLAHGRHRAVRAVQRDPLRPRRAPVRRAALHPRPRRELPALARDLEPGLHGVRPAARRPARAAAVQERRHRHGLRAPGERPPGRQHQLRHGHLHADPRVHAHAARPRSRDVRGGALQLPGHRRPRSRADLPRAPTACGRPTRAAAT